MARYTCCGLTFRTPKELAAHTQSTHGAGAFRAELTCCGMDFESAAQATDHVRKVHGAAKFEIAT